MKFYTIGEVFRKGLLRNHQGLPYKHKATVSRIINKLPHETKDTAWGKAKVVSQETIDEFNKLNSIDMPF